MPAIRPLPDPLTPHAATGRGGWVVAFLVLSLLPAVLLTPGYAFGVRGQALALLIFCLAIAIWTTLGERGEARAVGAGDGGEPTALLGARLMVLAAAIGVVVAEQKVIALSSLVWPIGLLLTHELARRIFQVSHGGRGVMFGWLLSATVVAALGLIGYRQFLLDGAVETSRSRFLSTALYPHSYVAAQSILPALPLAFAGLLYARKKRFRTLNGLATLTLGAFVVVCNSRAIWLGAACGIVTVIVIVYLARRASAGRRRRPLRKAATAVVLGGVALLPFSFTDTGRGAIDDVLQRGGDLWRPNHNKNHLSRLQVWESSARLAADHLPFGVGPGQFSAAFEPVYPGIGYAVHAHNQLLHTFAETGALGLTGLLLLLGSALRSGFRGAIAGGGPRDRRVLWIGATASLVAIVVHAQFESPLLVAPGVAAIGVLTGVLSARAPRLAAYHARAPARPLRGALLVALVAMSAIASLDTLAGVHAYRALVAMSDPTAPSSRDAVALATEATRIAPHLPFTWWVAAQAHRLAGDLPSGAAAFDHHEALSPGVPTVIYHHAATLAMLGEFERTIPLLERARRRSPGEHDRMTMDLARMLFSAGRTGEALVLNMELAHSGFIAANPILLRRIAECRIALGTGRVAALQALEAYERRIGTGVDLALPVLREQARALP